MMERIIMNKEEIKKLVNSSREELINWILDLINENDDKELIIYELAKLHNAEIKREVLNLDIKDRETKTRTQYKFDDEHIYYV